MQKAVALLHEPGLEGGSAPDGSTGGIAPPKVVASGRGAIARQILDLAFANGVKVRQDAELVDILELLELGSEIPPAAYAAVAEILSHLYRAHMAASDFNPTAGDPVR